MKEIPVAIAIIHQGGQVLICQRHQNDSFGGLWEFPGGKIEAGETPQQCLARELREELGIAVRVTGTFPPIDHTYPKVTVRLHPHLCTSPSSTPRPLASQRVQWVPAPRLREYTFPAGNAGLIEQVIERVNKLS